MVSIASLNLAGAPAEPQCSASHKVTTWIQENSVLRNWHQNNAISTRIHRSVHLLEASCLPFTWAPLYRRSDLSSTLQKVRPELHSTEGQTWALLYRRSDLSSTLQKVRLELYSTEGETWALLYRRSDLSSTLQKVRPELYSTEGQTWALLYRRLDLSCTLQKVRPELHSTEG